MDSKYNFLLHKINLKYHALDFILTFDEFVEKIDILIKYGDIINDEIFFYALREVCVNGLDSSDQRYGALVKYLKRLCGNIYGDREIWETINPERNFDFYEKRK